MPNKKLLKTMIAGFALMSHAGGAATPAETVTAATDRQGLAITIYNDDLALVKDVRRVRLARDNNQLVWDDVPAQMHPETAQLRHTSRPAGFRVEEQHFDLDRLTPEQLLEKHAGREVIVIRTHPTTGAETREAATVLATNGGVVLQFADRVETGVPGRLAFPSVPFGLRAKPALDILLVTPTAGAQTLELSYLTGGLSWRADYVAELDERDGRLDLNGWATLTNQSGAAYPEATLQLVAGNVNRVRDARRLPEAVAMSAKVADVPEMQQESLFEYHLYTLPRPIALAENQTKQVGLMTATRVPVRRQFLLEGAGYYYSGQHPELERDIKAGVFVEFDNRGEGLGVPLPGGLVRVYKRDSAGAAQFIGEARINHTPKNESVRLKLGDAFDLTADKKQTAFQKLAGSSRYNQVFESAYEIVLKNAKREAVTVTVREQVPGDWTMVGESLPHARPASGTAEWQVRVAAEGKTTLSYRVRVRY